MRLSKICQFFRDDSREIRLFTNAVPDIADQICWLPASGNGAWCFWHPGRLIASIRTHRIRARCIVVTASPWAGRRALLTRLRPEG